MRPTARAGNAFYQYEITPKGEGVFPTVSLEIAPCIIVWGGKAVPFNWNRLWAEKAAANKNCGPNTPQKRFLSPDFLVE